jgi:hypothetical protein
MSEDYAISRFFTPEGGRYDVCWVARCGQVLVEREDPLIAECRVRNSDSRAISVASILQQIG